MARQIDIDAVINWIRAAQQGSNPASPAAGYWYLFVKSDGFYLKDSGGNVLGPIRGMALDTIWDAAGDIVQGTGANTAGRLAIGTANQLLRVNAGATALEYASLGRVLISEQSPTGTTVTWSSGIDGLGYKSLQLELMGRTDKAGVTLEQIYLYLNNDTTATNYNRQALSGTASTASSSNVDDPGPLALPAANATANYAGMCKATIFDFSGTTFHKIILIENTRREGATSNFVNIQGLHWESTSAVTRVDLVTASGGNFISGTKARLYGVY